MTSFNSQGAGDRPGVRHRGPWGELRAWVSGSVMPSSGFLSILRVEMEGASRKAGVLSASTSPCRQTLWIPDLSQPTRSSAA